MNIADQHKKAAEFIERWQGRGDEKQETQKFWLDFMQNVLDVPNAINNTEFEYRTAGGGYIDMLCTDSRFLVEQKSKNVDLDKTEEHLTVFRNIFSENRSRNYIEKQLSEKAGLLVANLHNELAKQYSNPDSEEEHHSLTLLTIRIVFCLYA